MKKLLFLLSVALFITLSAQAGTYHQDLLKGSEDDLIKADKSKADIAALHGKKYTFIYFSAHWCSPCRAVTPELVEFYNTNLKNNDFELLFVSYDHTQDAMLKYMEEAKMPWIGLKVDSPSAKRLKQKFNSHGGIPCLILLNEKDEQIMGGGHDLVLKKYRELRKK